MTTTTHTTWELWFPGPIPAWLAAIVAVIGLVWLCWLLKRELRRRHTRGAIRWLYAIRVSIVLLLALIASQPVLSLRTETSRPSPVVVVLDPSDSMRFTDDWAGSALFDLAAVVTDPMSGRDTRPQQAYRALTRANTQLDKTTAALRDIHSQLAEGLPWGDTFGRILADQQTHATTLLESLREQRRELALLEAQMRAAATSDSPVPPFYAAPFQAVDAVIAAADAFATSLTAPKTTTPSVDDLTTCVTHATALQTTIANALPMLVELQGKLDNVTQDQLPVEQQNTLQRVANLPRAALAEHAVMKLIRANPSLPMEHPDWASIAGHTTPGTDLYRDLNDVLSERQASNQISAIVVLSDGGQNLPPSPEVMRRLAQRDIPLFTVGVGQTARAADLAIIDYKLPGIVRARREFPASLTIKTDIPKDTDVELVILAGEEEIERRGFKASGEPQTHLALDLRAPDDDLGPWTIRVDMASPDALPANNQVRFPMRVVSKDQRVLVIAKSPRWDLVYLTRELAELPVKLDTVYWGSNQADDEVKRGSGSGRIPDSASRLKRYSLILLDGPPFPGWRDQDPELFSSYMADGGCLLLSIDGQGNSYLDIFGEVTTPTTASPLQPSLSPPLAAVAFNADPTSSVAAWRQLAPPQQMVALKYGTIPLLVNGDGAVCLSMDMEGRGRSYQLSVSDLYRLREWDGGPSVNRFLATLCADLLTPIAQDDLPVVYPQLPLPGGLAWAKPPPESQSSWTLIEKATGRQLATLSGTQPKRIRIPRDQALIWKSSTGIESSQPLAQPVSAESLVLNLQEQTLIDLAAAGNGTYMPLQRLGTLPDLVTLKTDIEVTFRQVRLWNLTAILLLIAALMTLDWVLRRRNGLVL